MIEISADKRKQYVKIAVIGVGGGGNNAIDRMKREGINDVTFIGVNTDVQVLDDCLADVKVQIGCKLTDGLGAGANPEIGEKSAMENLDNIEEAVEGCRLVFITCGLGGGTGSGAVPVIAKACKEKGILTVAVVTKPFEYEGVPRCNVASEALEKLKDNVDTMIVIPNDKLLDVYPDMDFCEAFEKADEVLHHSVMGISNIIVNKGMINLDFNDLCTILRGKGLAHLGIGTSKGSGSVMDALSKALNSPLLETSIEGAGHVLFNVEGKASMKELNEAAKTIQGIAGEGVNIIWGTVGSAKEQEEVTVTLIATGISGDNNRKTETKTEKQTGKTAFESKIKTNYTELVVPEFLSKLR